MKTLINMTFFFQNFVLSWKGCQFSCKKFEITKLAKAIKNEFEFNKLILQIDSYFIGLYENQMKKTIK